MKTKSAGAECETRFTYADYCTWSENERWELIDGVAYAMTPGPGLAHQRMAGELFWQLKNFFRGKPCEVFIAPLDVRLPNGEESDDKVDTVVQPDLLVVCDQKKLDDKGGRGAPDLAIEVLSPSSGRHDRVRKLNLYERHGVKEYWMVDPVGEVLVFHLSAEGRFARPLRYSRDAKILTPLFEGLEVDLSTVFPVPVAPKAAPKRVKETAKPFKAKKKSG